MSTDQGKWDTRRYDLRIAPSHQGMHTYPDPERILSPSVSRAIQVIERLSSGPSSLTELSRELDIPKSTLHGILTTLAAHDWIKIEGRTLRQSKGLFRAVLRYSRNELLKPTFLEIGQRIVGETGETTFLGVLEGESILHMARVDGTASLRYVAQEGEYAPAHASALGKVLLADMPTEQVTQLFESATLPALTPHSVTELNDLLSDLPEIQAQGYALDQGEVSEGLYCVAAPIRDASGAAIASVALAAPEFRFQEHVSKYVSQIRQAATEISMRLGHKPKG